MARSTHRRKSYPNTGRAFQALVAEVVRALDPGAVVLESEWVSGPDGRRDMDVTVRGSLESEPYLAVIECKDYRADRTGKVGIELVDALESKRRDVGAHAALICSNAGFTGPAMKKAARTNIGLIAVLKAGDGRVRAEIRKRYYFPLMRAPPGAAEIKFNMVRPLPGGLNSADEVFCDGVLVWKFLAKKAVLHRIMNRTAPPLTSVYLAPERPVDCSVRGLPVLMKSARMVVRLDIEWCAQELRLDASAGIFDYLRGRVSPAPGATVQWKGLNPDTADRVPIEEVDELPRDLRGPEVELSLSVIEGLYADILSADIPRLDPHVRAEDTEEQAAIQG